MVINNQMTSLASTINEYTKPMLWTQIIDMFIRTYTWVATGELVTDGITPFNMTYAIKSSMHAVAQKVSHLLVTVEFGGVAMSFAMLMSSSRAIQLSWQPLQPVDTALPPSTVCLLT